MHPCGPVSKKQLLAALEIKHSVIGGQATGRHSVIDFENTWTTLLLQRPYDQIRVWWA